MNIDRYTKGKWIADGLDISSVDELGNATWVIHNYHVNYFMKTSVEEDVANIERAALCVNFCDGFTNKELKDMIDMKSAIQNARAKQAEITSDWILGLLE